MKKLLTYLILTCSISFAQAQDSKIISILDINNVSEIYISAYCSPLDSCRNTPYLLSQAMTNELVNLLNASSSKSDCEYETEYFLRIILINGSYTTYEINKALIRKNGNTCIDIGKSRYFENLWLVLDEQRIKLNQN